MRRSGHTGICASAPTLAAGDQAAAEINNVHATAPARVRARPPPTAAPTLRNLRRSIEVMYGRLGMVTREFARRFHLYP
jgi:hypothetical protein